MKRVRNIIEPHTQRIGKIDISDILNSSIPNELHHIDDKRLKELKQGRSITIMVRATTIIHIQKF